MKTLSFIKTLALAAAFIIGSTLDNNACAQSDKFITNQEMENGLTVAKTIFKQDGNYLHRHMRYEFAYDEQNRLIEKQASKWNGATDEWEPYFRISYRYTDAEIIMNYARWNQSHQAYDKECSESVYELDENNLPVAYRSYRQTGDKPEWALVCHHRFDPTAFLLAAAE